MYIETIELKDFRNYEYLKTSFDKHINLIYGDNAQGKTNILEAIYMASTARSHRSTKDEELIRIENFDEIGDMESMSDPSLTDAHIKLIVQKEFTSDRVDIHIKKNKQKGIAINGVPLRRSSELFGHLQVVFFYPEDLDIIRRGPNVRRHFLDIDISRVDKVYLNGLIDYNKLLESRNKLLKDIVFRNRDGDRQTLEIIDAQLVRYGKKVILGRRNYLEKINVLTEKIHRDLSGSNEKLKIVYQPSTDIDLFEADLEKSKEKDLKTGMTGVGPHRDDFTFFINGKDVKKFGSQGQKRTAALSLKLSQIDIAKNEMGEMPVLLLDDVLSELDSSRQEYLLKCIGNMQTIITCTGQDEWIKSRMSVDKVFRVKKGKVIEDSQEV